MITPGKSVIGYNGNVSWRKELSLLLSVVQLNTVCHLSSSFYKCLRSFGPEKEIIPSVLSSAACRNREGCFLPEISISIAGKDNGRHGCLCVKYGSQVIMVSTVALVLDRFRDSNKPSLDLQFSYSGFIGVFDAAVQILGFPAIIATFYPASLDCLQCF